MIVFWGIFVLVGFIGTAKLCLWFGFQQGRIRGRVEGFEQGKDATLAALL